MEYFALLILIIICFILTAYNSVSIYEISKKIKEFDSKWQDLSPKRTIEFDNLNSINYLFKKIDIIYNYLNVEETKTETKLVPKSECKTNTNQDHDK